MTRNTGPAIDWTTRMYMLLGLICATVLTVTAPEGMFIYAAYATASLFILVVGAEIAANLLQGGSVTGRARTVIVNALQPSNDPQQETTPLADSAVIENEELPDAVADDVEKLEGDRVVYGETFPVKETIKQTADRYEFVPGANPVWIIDAGSEPALQRKLDELQADAEITHPVNVEIVRD